MAIIKQDHIAWTGTISTFEANLANYFDSLSDDIFVSRDTENNTITVSFKNVISFIITRSSNNQSITIVKNGVSYPLSGYLYGGNNGWEIYSAVDDDIFLLWVNAPYASSNLTGSLRNYLNDGKLRHGFMLCVIPDTDGGYYIGHERLIETVISSSNNDILKHCEIEKYGDASINGRQMFNIFDYKSKIGYIDFVFGAVFGSGSTKSFKCPKIANSSSIVSGESYSLSSGSFFSVNDYALVSIDN